MSDQSSNGPRRLFLKGALATPVFMAGSNLLAPPAQAHGGSGWPDGPGGLDARHVTKGPSSSAEPYLAPSIAGAKTVSILTAGDSVGGYRMVGIPDGMGAFANDNGDFTLVVNHELALTGGVLDGVVRAHGAKGSFVSRWVIDSRTLRVKKGQDLTPSQGKVFVWNTTTKAYEAATTPVEWQRHCSGDLAAPSAYYYRGLGTPERIYLNGEEVDHGRGWARILTGQYAGQAWQLPRFGRMAYENAVACPYPQRKTIVALTDDSSAATGPLPNNGSEVYFYIGTKTNSRHPLDSAGLTNGTVFGVSISVDGVHVDGEDNVYGLGNAGSGYVNAGRFDLVNLGDVSSVEKGFDGSNPASFEYISNAAGITRLQRCEDGAWDPREDNQGDFYFVTTASITSNCRLWRLRFDDIEHPELGGTVEILLRGDEGHRMLDNVTIDKLGRILMDEDPGSEDRIAKVWLYGIDTRQFIQVAAHNPYRFDPQTYPNPLPAGTEFLTRDEETSGIVDAAHILGDGWFLLDVQAHVNLRATDPEIVEGGQLLALWVDPDVGIKTSDRDGNRHDDNHGRR